MVPRTGTHSATCDSLGTTRAPLLDTGTQCLAQASTELYGLVSTAESLLHEQCPMLKQILPELPAGSGEFVQGVEIDIAHELRDDAGGLVREMGRFWWNWYGGVEWSWESIRDLFIAGRCIE